MLGPYLVVITKKSFVGHIKGHEVWKIKGTDVLAFPRAKRYISQRARYEYDWSNFFVTYFGKSFCRVGGLILTALDAWVSDMKKLNQN